MTHQLRYLPLFESDLAETVGYIAHVLLNPQAASDLVDAAEAAILRRLAAPDGYAPFGSVKHRDHPYYTIPVKNYLVFYILVGDVMEVRRFLYARRDLPPLLT